MIKPSVTSDDGSSFDKLLNVMEDSDHEGVKELANLIRISLRRVGIMCLIELVSKLK